MTDKPENMSDKNPGDDPKAAQQEAKDLKPNQDTEEERDDILGREFEAENEHDLDSRERQHRPLTDPADNAEVDRVSTSALPRPTVVRQPEARPYLISPAALRNIFVGSSVAGVAVIVGLLTLASSGNNARYTPADETQYQRTLQEATETITATGVGEDGTARIPIEEAIAVVAAQGLEPINTALAAPPVQAEEPPTEQPAQPEAQASEAGQEQADAPAQAQMNQEQAGQEQTNQEQADQEQTGEEQADSEQTGEEQADQEQAAAAAPAATEVVDTAAGGAVYETNCASCHQATGAGIPGAFPPLVGHVPTLYNADRSYLVNLLLYGLQGEIQVLGEPYNGVMPAWSQLSDDDIAATLNYISTEWDNEGALEDFQPFQADEIASARDAALSADEVYALRQELGLSADE